MRDVQPKANAVVAAWGWFALTCSKGGPMVSVAPWIGTMAGSLLISGSAGQFGLVVLGAAIAAIGCLPVAAAAYWSSLDRTASDLRAARERAVLLQSVELLQAAASVTSEQRAKRVAMLRRVAGQVVDFLCDRAYSEVPGLRTVVYAISDDGSALEVLQQAGRPDSAHVIAFGSDHGKKVLDQLSGPKNHVYESDIEGRPYRSYLAAPIRRGGVIFGMLSVDATETLSLADGYLLEILSSALCIFFVEAARGEHKR
jgi:hypothetical protein